MRHRNTIPGLLLALVAAFLVAACGAGSNGDAAKSESGQQTAESDAQDTADTTVVITEPEPEPQVEQEPTCMNCGIVVAIEQHDKMRGETSKAAIAGTIVGAVAGVMLGSSQFSGDEETAAEIVGGLAGAAAGHEIAQRAFTEDYYIVRVDMMNGTTNVIRVPEVGTLSVGQQVRVESGTIRPR